MPCMLLATDIGTVLAISQGGNLCPFDIHVCVSLEMSTVLDKNCYHSPERTNCGLEVDQNFS